MLKQWPYGAMVARLTPDQKAGYSSHSGVMYNFSIFIFRDYFFRLGVRVTLGSCIIFQYLFLKIKPPFACLGLTLIYIYLKLYQWPYGAMVARLTPDQKAGCSSHSGVMYNFSILIFKD